MVYVEPEVVNPPKEQSVPQFNKKEIIEVVREALNSGLLGNLPRIYEVSNIQKIPSEILEKLKPGDFVRAGSASYGYVVFSATSTMVCLGQTLGDLENVVTISSLTYEKDGDSWPDGNIYSLDIPTADNANEGDVLTINGDNELEWAAPGGN